MEHFFELVFELLFGLAKNQPDKMPEIEYLSHFTVRHPFKKTLARICATLVWIVVFSLLWIFIKHETRFLYAFFVFSGIILLVLSLIAVSFKCTVDEEELYLSSCGVFKKKLKWEDVMCVRTVENKDESAVIIALYDRNGKCAMDFNTEMQNAWYIIKMAEHKNIEIKNEKDLSLKQLRHL
ncbi:MAG: hypothetical protein IJX55_10695 [Clostridia bacterium]|nr:hypothetical protein [Clostridia bacterium]